ncbi:hypothetical protein GCM10022408_01130 [Hymenobacter fastidiosus]|uniref:Uncharacterized protein n=1 Tax=Hymenobacter fastidiosus TaxID=486264 RepID=A0ABP7RB57_9BACT
MEKVQMLLLILLGLGVFVWRLVQKARETAAQESRERPNAKVPPLPNTSFQELLKQMQAQNETGQQQTGPTAAEKAAEFQRQAPPRETSQQSARRAAQPAPLPTTGRPAQRPTELQTRRAATPLVQLAEPTTSDSTRRRVGDMLRNPADVRAAFVLSEILKRKFE